MGEAHQNTFQWIYEPGGFDQWTCRWDSFVQWLKEGSGIYWINGKAGSGKSTLMNYICQDDRTTDLLRTWSGTQGVFTPKFFFWNAGTTLEKSSEGLLRSLLYQFLQRFPSLAPHSCQNQPALGAADESEQECEQIAAWTERRLHATFDKVICQAQEICRICIFIDGLDETSEEPDAAIAVIKKLQSANTKICLSSRPDRSYIDAFESSAKLRLQDLTEPDIRRYIVDELRPSLPTDSEKEISKILDDVARKAKGVFLWVKLVVKALKNGLRNDDSLEQLRIRVDSMPSDMEALYAKMLSNIDIAYQEEGAQLFHIALANLTDSLLDITLALSKAFERLPEFSLQDVLGLCKRSLRRIPVICAGLLEVHQEDRDSEEGGGKIRPFECYATLPCRSASSLEQADISFFERYTHVEFVHRTAMDFLRQSKQGRLFLEKNAKSCSSPRSTYVRALLAKVTLLGLREIPHSTEANFRDENRLIAMTNFGAWYNDSVDTTGYHIVNNIMGHVFWEEWNTAVAQVSLCDDVDRTLANVWQRYLDSSPDSPWFTRRTRIKGVSGPAPVPLWPRMSSQSSSQVSFRSARSEPMVLQNRQIDFPGFAVDWGLSRYVIANFDLRQDHPDKEYVNYLLCCCVQAIEWSGYLYQPLKMLVQRFNLMNDLLSRGGNPNSYVESFSNTIWGQFLVSCSSWDPVMKPCAQDLQIASATTAKAFLKAGADAGTKHVRRNFELFPVHLAKLCPDGRLEIHKIHIQIHFEISVLYAVLISLAYLPEWKAVEEIILAKGGYELYQYTHVTFYTPTAEGRLPYKISERQHKTLVTRLNVAHHGYLKRCSVTQWNPVLAEICRAHLTSALDSDGQIASDDDASSDANAEEEFYESLNFQNSADVEDNHALE